MRNVGIDDFFKMGKNYQILKENEGDLTYLELHCLLFDYATILESANMEITKEALEQFDFDKKWSEIMEKSEKKYYKNRLVPIDKLSVFQEIIKIVEVTFFAELSYKRVYELTEKRYSFKKLLHEPNLLFAKNVFNHLPEVAQYDFKESCKCLAFDRFTACAFHSLRGTEGVLKFFYENLYNTTTKNKSWYFFISKIVRDSKSCIISPPVSREITDVLDLIRDFYRNKTQHPHLIYSSDETQDLLTHCIRSVNQIISELKQRKLL